MTYNPDAALKLLQVVKETVQHPALVGLRERTMHELHLMNADSAKEMDGIKAEQRKKEQAAAAKAQAEEEARAKEAKAAADMEATHQARASEVQVKDVANPDPAFVDEANGDATIERRV